MAAPDGRRIVLLCSYGRCENPAVCRIPLNSGEYHVHYCADCLPKVEAQRGVRQVEALLRNHH